MSVKSYSGSCQCGAVAFEAELDLDKTITCNCSRCQRLGVVLSVTTPEKFKLLRGADNLTEYLFNTKKIHHQFCKTCGVESFSPADGADGKPVGVAVNVNCLEGVEPRSLTSQHFDGRSR
jgi:hypothetical protein